MNDRDRLAADLLNVGVEWAHYEGDETWDTWTADRLIALGWTRRPTVEEMDDLTAAISGCGYASEAVEVVEEWTRKKWGIESALTTQFAKAYREDTDGDLS